MSDAQKAVDIKFAQRMARGIAQRHNREGAFITHIGLLCVTDVAYIKQVLRTDYGLHTGENYRQCRMLVYRQDEMQQNGCEILQMLTSEEL